METRIHRQSLLNSYAAADIDTSSMSGYVKIPGLNPIPTAGIKNVIKTVSTAERQQFVTITMPTIVLSTRYAVRGHELQAQGMDKEYNKLKSFAYTSPATLSGTALTDKVNVAWVIGWKIMQVAKAGKLHVKAGPVATFTNATVAYAGAVGDIIVGVTSGAKAIVAKVNSGTEKLVIMLTNLDFTDTETITVNGAAATGTTCATNVYTGNLGILDDAGYFPAKGHRKGATSWAAGDNITTVTVTSAATYSFGIGTRLLDDVPVLERSTPNLNSGLWNFATNNLPVSGYAYAQYIIVYDVDAQVDSMTSAGSKIENAQAVWLYESEGDFGATDAALLAL